MGSIAPDLPMLLPIPSVVHFAHTPLGLATIDLAIGVFGFISWQALFGPAVVAFAPRALRTRLPDRAPAGLAFHCAHFARIGRVAAALLLGAVTHLVWDGFTHDWMWGPQRILWLSSRHGPWTGSEWVQHISDFTGVAILIVWVAAWWRATPERTEDTVGLTLPTRVAAWLVVLCPAAFGFYYWLSGGFVFLAFTRGGGLGVIGLAVVAVAWRVHTRRMSTIDGRTASRVSLGHRLPAPDAQHLGAGADPLGLARPEDRMDRDTAGGRRPSRYPAASSFTNPRSGPDSPAG